MASLIRTKADVALIRLYTNTVLYPLGHLISGSLSILSQHASGLCDVSTDGIAFQLLTASRQKLSHTKFAPKGDHFIVVCFRNPVSLVLKKREPLRNKKVSCVLKQGKRHYRTDYPPHLKPYWMEKETGKRIQPSLAPTLMLSRFSHWWSDCANTYTGTMPLYPT